MRPCRLAWRVTDLPSMLVLTYRDDELRDDHALRRVLDALARQEVQRVALRPLSAGAVEELSAPHGADPGAVLSATGGNPFFVTEVLASPDVEVPATVRDAVLARLRELDDDTQQSLELLSTIPGQAERWLVERLLGDRTAALDGAERRGVLQADPGHVWFRHELARRAIEQQLPSAARVDYNRQVLAALVKHPQVELSRLAHHAHQAGEPEQVVEHGVAAAREAATAGAFHEALAHYELVLRWSDLMPDEQRATVMEDSVWLLYNLSRFDQAVTRAREVVQLREQLGDQAALITLSRTLYMVNDPTGSEQAVTRAVALLQPLDDSRRLARAYTYLAAILTLTDRLDEAITRARQALELGERTGQPDVVAHSLNYLGYALLGLGDPSGAEHLGRSAAIARAAHQYEYAQRAYTNLVEGLYRLGRFNDLDEPIAPRARLRARVRLRLPRVQPGSAPLHAAHLAGTLGRSRGRPAAPPGRRGPWCPGQLGLSALGRLLARKGDAAAGAPLQRAWRAAARTNSVQAIALAGIAWVEAAWLAGDHQGARQLAKVPLERTTARGAERYRGELLRYLVRCGQPSRGFAGCPLSTPSASKATGAAPRRRGSRSTPPTSRRSSWRRRASRRSCWTRCGSSTSSAPWQPVTSSGKRSGSWASPACPAARCHAPAPTRPGSPTGRSRCSGCSPTGSPTPRSPSGWSSPSARSTTTSPRSSPSSTSPRGVRQPAPTPRRGEIGTARPHRQ
jgi:tetratricopeptide (TPR) repeat protein